MQDDGMKGTRFVGAKKVIPRKNAETVTGAEPGINEKETKVFEIARSHAIVHPRAVVVHSTDAAIANAAVVRIRWLEGLALSAHAVTVLEESLLFAGNGLYGDTAGIGEACFGVAG